MVIETRLREPGGSELDLWLRKAAAEMVAVYAEQADQARRAWRRFGKRRYHAGLNFGDRFSYALSALTQEPRRFILPRRTSKRPEASTQRDCALESFRTFLFVKIRSRAMVLVMMDHVTHSALAGAAADAACPALRAHIAVDQLVRRDGEYLWP
jgi:hypothetical protein